MRQVMTKDKSKCNFCGSEIKSKQSFCPACGRDISGSEGKSKAPSKGSLSDFLYISGFVLVFAVIFFVVSDKPVNGDTHSHEAQNQMTTMDDLLANLPENYNDLVELGNRFMDNRHYAVAAECYRRALAINDDDPDIVCDLGSCLHATGDFDGAVDMFQKTIQLDSLHAIAYFNLGIVYRTMDKNDEAKQYWGKLITMFPDREISDSARKYIESFSN